MKTSSKALLAGTLGLVGAGSAALFFGRRRALEEANALFHESYGRARSEHEVCSPVLIVFEDELILRKAGTRKTWNIRPAPFHAFKVAAHAAVALYVLADRLLEAPDGAGNNGLAHLRPRVEAALREVDGAEARATRQLLTRALRFLDQARQSRLTRSALDTFARECGHDILELTDEATRVNLDALAAAADEVWRELAPEELDTLEVVVAGDHQARRRSLALQYFVARLGEAPGEERRVTYAESAASEEQALGLVGARRLDARIAGAFFGDPRRLQRDILGDAAEARLASKKA